MFGELREIEVGTCPKLQSVISLDDINPRQLKKIKVYDCEMMEEIITGTTTRGRDSDHLPKHMQEISHLHLEGLLKLEQFTATTQSDHSDVPFFNGQLMTTTKTRTIGELREIEVGSCPKLRSVISLDNINPRKLKKIKVYNCEMIEEIMTIITTRGRDCDHLPKQILEISHLHLERLPKLEQFTATTKSDDLDMPFFNGQVEFPKLESLYLELLNCPKIWSDQLPSPRHGFQSLTTLEVIFCDNLKGLIPSSMIETDFVNLKTLCLEHCEAMEEVVFTKEYFAQDAKISSSMGIKKISFPKLKVLQLKDLPNMERFCACDHVDFPSLLHPQIENCPKLWAFITSFMPTMETGSEDSINSVDKHRHFDDEDLEIRCQLPDHQQSGGGGVEQQEHDDDVH